jgi:hypothetical protein
MGWRQDPNISSVYHVRNNMDLMDDCIEAQGIIYRVHEGNPRLQYYNNTLNNGNHKIVS